MFGLQLGRLGIAGSLFNESALWPAGASSPGLWIDPSYSASQWQDSAGTTALSTVGTVLDSSNPVGLILDRKGGLALGPELVTNTGGPFTALTGFSTYQANIALSSGEIVITATDVAAPLAFVVIADAVVGKTYKITASLRAGVGGVVKILGDNGGGSYPLLLTSTSSTLVTVSAVMVAGGIEIGFGIGTGGTVGDTAAIYAISVREIPGLHLSQSTSAARPVASGRKNLLVGTATLSTQSVTVTAIPHTINFSGGGTVTASGTYTGALTSGQTFTPTAGTLTLTVAGSVTSAQLERGSAATTYQAVVSDSSYTATGFPQYLKFDGVDDVLSSATFSAGTLTSSMDCLIAVRRDSTANMMLAYNDPPGSYWFGVTESGSVGRCYDSGVGNSVTVLVDGAQLSGGTSVTRGTLHSALTVGAWHVVEFRNLDLNAFSKFAVGQYSGYALNGAIGKIELFASGQDASRDKARARMAAYFGVTLP